MAYLFENVIGALITVFVLMGMGFGIIINTVLNSKRSEIAVVTREDEKRTNNDDVEFKIKYLGNKKVNVITYKKLER